MSGSSLRQGCSEWFRHDIILDPRRRLIRVKSDKKLEDRRVKVLYYSFESMHEIMKHVQPDDVCLVLNEIADPHDQRSIFEYVDD